MSKAPAFQLYAQDFDMDTGAWDVEELGIYLRLLLHEWVNGSLPDDPVQLARIARVSHKRFLAGWRIIEFKFIRDGIGKLQNKRMEEEREKQRKYTESQQESGKRGAEKRWKKNGDPNGDPNGENIALQSSPSLKDSLAKANVLEVPSSNDHCPHQEIIKLYRKYLPMCPEIVKWTDTRASHLRARWNENEDQRSLEWWEALFQQIAQSKFLTGRVTGRGGKPFFASLEWIVKPENFAKILEGRYHE